MSHPFKPFNQQINNHWINTEAFSEHKHKSGSAVRMRRSLRGGDVTREDTEPLRQTCSMTVHDFIILHYVMVVTKEILWSEVSAAFANVKLRSSVPVPRCDLITGRSLLCLQGPHHYLFFPQLKPVPVSAETTRFSLIQFAMWLFFWFVF